MGNILNNFKLGCLILFLPFSLGAKDKRVDSVLEKLITDSAIVDTREIKIPGYPKAYNPSLIAYKGGYLLSFRYVTSCPEEMKNPFRRDLSFIGLARLDKKFKVSEKSIQLLNTLSYSTKYSLSAEDARLFYIGERIFILFNDLPPLATRGGFSMYLGELIEENGRFVLREPAKFLNYPFVLKAEKNWSPFVSGETLFVIYSDHPRTILEVDLATGNCHQAIQMGNDPWWDLGAVRGGTPACLIDDQFLTFFHSSFLALNEHGKAYVIGAYLFDQNPPFAIRAITPKPLGKLSYYTDGNPSKVVFPGGFVVENQFIHVVWGKDDNRIFMTTFDRKRLTGSMVPMF